MSNDAFATAKVPVQYMNTALDQLQYTNDRAILAALQPPLSLKEALALYGNTAAEEKGYSKYRIRKFYEAGWHIRGNTGQFCKIIEKGPRAGVLELWWEW